MIPSGVLATVCNQSLVTRLAEWVAKEPERRKRSAEEKKKKLEKRRSEPKHHFNDTSYMDQIRSTEENIDNALQQGLQAAASSTSTKTKIPESVSASGVTKMQNIWYIICVK